MGRYICPSNSEKPKQYTGCPNGMDCTFLHEHNIEGCVDENHDSTEDIRTYSENHDSTEDITTYSENSNKFGGNSGQFKVYHV